VFFGERLSLPQFAPALLNLSRGGDTNANQLQTAE
jgi:hypothetical protein